MKCEPRHTKSISFCIMIRIRKIEIWLLASIGGQVMKRRIYKTLEEIMDPALGIDIVNLGLIYEVAVKDDTDIEIVMTTTSVECPLAEYMKEQTKKTLTEKIDGIQNVEVKMVWNPQWSSDRMTRYAKLALDL